MYTSLAGDYLVGHFASPGNVQALRTSRINQAKQGSYFTLDQDPFKRSGESLPKWAEIESLLERH
jgi:hypothetical protein